MYLKLLIHIGLFKIELKSNENKETNCLQIRVTSNDTMNWQIDVDLSDREHKIKPRFSF